jgi:hypothetical protein
MPTNNTIPPPTAEDLAQDINADYQYFSDCARDCEPEDCGEYLATLSYIRRCFAAELERDSVLGKESDDRENNSDAQIATITTNNTRMREVLEAISALCKRHLKCCGSLPQDIINLTKKGIEK